jgi:hypothetical protein
MEGESESNLSGSSIQINQSNIPAEENSNKTPTTQSKQSKVSDPRWSTPISQVNRKVAFESRPNDNSRSIAATIPAIIIRKG